MESSAEGVVPGRMPTVANPVPVYNGRAVMSRAARCRCADLLSCLGVLVLAVMPAGVARAQATADLVLVGAPEVHEGLRISIAYHRRPVVVEPVGPPVEGGAVHLQVEVEAVSGNPYGFDADDSIPYLRIAFVVVHEPTGRRVEGSLDPMVSRDGFHYGASVPVAAGGHTITIDVPAPEGLARHTDPRTGVAAWWRPFKVTRRFVYTPD